MSRSVRQPKRRPKKKSLVKKGLSHGAMFVARHPLQVSGATAFLIALSFVSVNAIWKQPQLHPSAFVSTRVFKPNMAIPTPTPSPFTSEVPPRVDSELPVNRFTIPQTTGSIRTGENSTHTVEATDGDNTIRAVQQVLNTLGLYSGTVDGLSGPQTRTAVENYRKIVGLVPGSGIDTALLQQLGLAPGGSVEPKNSNKPIPVSAVAIQEPLSDQNAVLKRVQEGLRAFGNESIQVDGVMGQSTREAIREFQSLFSLKITGEADAEFLAKMKEIGLTN